ncbi:hypothetical protein TWF173_008656 [Orbilia oligospora]|nr:hypothetical protein TWF173_008656 [Orbilia oligospora]
MDVSWGLSNKRGRVRETAGRTKDGHTLSKTFFLEDILGGRGIPLSVVCEGGLVRSFGRLPVQDRIETTLGEGEAEDEDGRRRRRISATRVRVRTKRRGAIVWPCLLACPVLT